VNRTATPATSTRAWIASGELSISVGQRARRRPRSAGEVDRLEGDFDLEDPDRTETDRAVALDLILQAKSMDHLEPSRDELLRYAGQLLGRGHESDLRDVLSLGNEYVRKAVLQRWKAIDTPTARDCLQQDSIAFRKFMADLRKALEDSGLQTAPYGNDSFRLQPGNIGLNFSMIFADCRRPGGMDQWVKRFSDRVAGR